MFASFIEKLINSIMSEAGLAAIILLLCLAYQTWQLYNERKEIKRLNDKILTLATNQVSAMNELQAVLKGVMNLIPERHL